MPNFFRLMIVSQHPEKGYKLQHFIVCALTAECATLTVGFRPDAPYKVFVQRLVREGIVCGLSSAPFSYMDLDRLMYHLMNQPDDEPFELTEQSELQLALQPTNVLTLDATKEERRAARQKELAYLNNMDTLVFGGESLRLSDLYTNRDRDEYPQFYVVSVPQAWTPIHIDYREHHYAYATHGVQEFEAPHVDIVAYLCIRQPKRAEQVASRIVASIEGHPIGKHVRHVERCMDPSGQYLESLVFRTDLEEKPCLNNLLDGANS